MMKKVLCLVLTLCMVLALAACGGKNSAPADSGGQTPAPDAQPAGDTGSELITVGVINNDPKFPEEEMQKLQKISGLCGGHADPRLPAPLYLFHR